MKEIRAYAKQHRLSLGKAASELVHRGVRFQVGVRKVNGLAVFDAPGEFPLITTQRVRELLAEE